MFNPVPKDLNVKNLIEISALLHDIEHFIFFGTLLGITREGDLLEDDDDIDIYVDINFRDQLISKLQSKYDIKLGEAPNNTNYFLQLKIPREGFNTFIDFYLFEKVNDRYIVEKYNFFGQLNPFDLELRVPLSLIYPIKKITFRDKEICVPFKPKDICKFIYGKNWKKPLNKNVDYRIDLFYGRPIQLVGLRGRIIGRLLKDFRTFKRALYL